MFDYDKKKLYEIIIIMKNMEVIDVTEVKE